MPTKRLILTSAGCAARLRAIRATDLEDLRFWKNCNRPAFFTKKELTPEDQGNWYAGYLERPDDWMFVVEAEGLKSGCLGYRLSGRTADVYNVIAAREARGKGHLKAAMALLCSYLKKGLVDRIEAKVVRGNPALAWYEACGFRVDSDMREYVLVVLDKSFKPVAVEAK